MTKSIKDIENEDNQVVITLVKELVRQLSVYIIPKLIDWIETLSKSIKIFDERYKNDDSNNTLKRKIATNNDQMIYKLTPIELKKNEKAKEMLNKCIDVLEYIQTLLKGKCKEFLPNDDSNNNNCDNNDYRS